MKPEWLNRDLVRNHWEVALCTTPEMFLELQQSIGVRPEQIRKFPETGAQVSFYRPFVDFTDGGRKTAIVVLSRQEATPIQIAAMLVHEAVHIVQEEMKDIGERKPSREFLAYSVQAVSQNLLYEFVRQTVGAE